MTSGNFHSAPGPSRYQVSGYFIRLRILCLGILLLLGVVTSAVPALADGCIPYCDVGNIAPTNVFNAVQTGNVTGYFVGRGPAGDTD